MGIIEPGPGALEGFSREVADDEPIVLINLLRHRRARRGRVPLRARHPRVRQTTPAGQPGMAVNGGPDQVRSQAAGRGRACC